MGLYIFNGLTLCNKVAPGLFKQVIGIILNDIYFAIACIDDVLIKKWTLRVEYSVCRWCIQNNKWIQV